MHVYRFDLTHYYTLALQTIYFNFLIRIKAKFGAYFLIYGVHFQSELDTLTKENTALVDELNNTKLELDTQRGHLLITKDTVQKLNQEKGAVSQGKLGH